MRLNRGEICLAQILLRGSEMRQDVKENTSKPEMGVWMMRLGKCLAITAVLLLPALAIAAVGPASNDALTIGEPMIAASANPGTSSMITVPLTMSNLNVLAAVDMPLKFGTPGDGIELREVRFDSRIDDFDVKIATIDNEAKTVLIGLVPMAFNPGKDRMAAGKGPIADLVFEVTDPTLTSFQIDTYTTERPRHQLMWVYSEVAEDGSRSVHAAYPEFKAMTIDVSAAGSNPSQVPTSYALNQNYPNPFNPSTEISFALSQAGHVRLSVYNVLGQQVRTLIDQDMEAGNKSITWDGRSDNGSPAASGIYFYRIQANDFVDTRKMTLLK
jgi:hypothetical protein